MFQNLILMASRLVLQDMLVLLIPVIPEPNLNLGGLHRLTSVQTVQWWFPWIVCPVCIKHAIALGEIWVNLHPCCLLGPVETVSVVPGLDDVSTGGQKRRRRTTTSAMITHHLTPLSRCTLSAIDSGSHERSRALLDQAFDEFMYQFNWRCFWCFSMTVPQFCFFLFWTTFLPTLLSYPTRQLATLFRFIFTEERAQIFQTDFTSE